MGRPLPNSCFKAKKVNIPLPKCGLGNGPDSGGVNGAPHQPWLDRAPHGALGSAEFQAGLPVATPPVEKMKRCRQFRGARARGLLGVEATWDDSGYSAGGLGLYGSGAHPQTVGPGHEQ